MSENGNPYFEVVCVPNGYQVVKIVDEWYRDVPGNLRKRRVIGIRYETKETPLEAQVIANLWNKEDGNVEIGGE